MSFADVGDKVICPVYLLKSIKLILLSYYIEGKFLVFEEIFIIKYSEVLLILFVKIYDGYSILSK